MGYTNVKGSKAHRRSSTKVKEHKRRWTKAFRIGPYRRKERRTKKQIAAAEARKKSKNKTKKKTQKKKKDFWAPWSK